VDELSRYRRVRDGLRQSWSVVSHSTTSVARLSIEHQQFPAHGSRKNLQLKVKSLHVLVGIKNWHLLKKVNNGVFTC